MKIGSPKAGIRVGAILLTPRPGEDTKEIPINKAVKGRRYADHQLQQLRKSADEKIEQSREVVRRQKKVVASEEQATKDAYRRVSQTGTTKAG